MGNKANAIFSIKALLASSFSVIYSPTSLQASEP
jgi:hypothetical protein